MKVYIDVGANDGSSSLNWARQSKDNIVFAFEPNPLLVAHIEKVVKDEGLENNYYIHKCAIADYYGVSKFNICENADRGCSSLLELSEAALTEWGGRRDMVPSSQIDVEVWTMEQICTLYTIAEIEYFHCDAQGTDLAVLKGFGEHIRKIKAGVVEAAAKPEILYKGQNSVIDTSQYLEQHGFKVTSVGVNDVQHNELNLHFVRV